MFVSMNDAGKVLEVVESRDNRYVLLYHEIGQTAVLGAYESVPGDDQIADILSGSDREAGRFRATVRHRPGGDSDVSLSVPVSPSDPAK